MTFKFSGFGGKSSLFGDKAGLFGGKGGLFGDKGGLFGGKGGFGRDCDNDDDDDHGSGHGSGHGGGSNAGGGTGGSTGGTQGTGWPDIPADTAGITFHVDYEADGVTDTVIPVGRTSDTKTFEDYLAQARDQIATDTPDVDPKDVIFKATITSRSGDETYYHFTGLEEDAPAEDEDEDEDDDRDCDKGHANFFKSLMGGGKSFDCGRDDERWSDDDDDRDEDQDDDDGFC